MRIAARARKDTAPLARTVLKLLHNDPETCRSFDLERPSWVQRHFLVGLAGRLRDAETLRRGKRRCPRCLRRLQVIEVGDDRRIELDRCPHEHGLWLDRGEMEAVVTSSTDGDAGAVASYFSELYRSELHTKEDERTKGD